MGVIQKNSFWSTVIGYLGVALGFVSSVILFPRLLTPEEVGLTNVFRNGAIILAQLSALGGSNIVLRFFPMFRSADGKYNGIFTFTFLLSVAGVLLFSALYIIFRPAIVDYYQGQSALFVKYCMLVLPIGAATVFFTLFSSWLRSMMRVIASAVYIEVALRCASMAAVLVYATGCISFEAFVWFFALGFAVPAVGLWLHCRRTGMITFSLRVTDQMRKYWKPALLYGIFCLFASMGSSLVGSIDSMMLARIGLESVAVYGIALNFVSMLFMPYRAMVSSASPLVAQYWHENSLRKLQNLYRKFSLNIVIVSLAFFLVVWLNVDLVYSLMKPVYATGKWALLILFAGRFFDMACGLNGTILGTSRKYRWDLYLSLLLIASAIVTNLLLIPPFGIEGAALATTISVVGINLARVLIVRRYFRLQPFSRPMLTVLLLAGAAWAAVAFIPPVGHWLADLAMRCALVGAIFGLPVYRMKISPDLNAMIDNMASQALNILRGHGKR